MEELTEKQQLSEEQKEISKRIDDILKVYYKKLTENKIDNKEEDNNHEKKVALGDFLKGKGLEPTSFVLWHKLMASTITGSEDLVPFFDTPDRDIEKFVINNFLKYI